MCLMTFLSASYLAAQSAGHEAHVHGIGSLNVALDGDVLYIELESPAANVVGFEHAPGNKREEHAAHQAIDTLENGGELFAPNRKAGCALQESVVHHSLQHETEEHGDHDNKHEPEATPDSTVHAKHDHEEEEGEHGEELHDEHSDIEATYTFSCSRPDMLREIDVRLFETFPGFEKIQLQLLTPDGQKGATLTPRDHRISF